jgi:putative oxidoreductase
MALGKMRSSLLPLAVTLLRVSTGVIMAAHGWQKLSNIPALTEMFTNMGLPYPQISVYLAIGGEFFGGLGLIVGLLTPIAAFGVLCTMAVAIIKVHWPHGLMAADNGFEYPMTLFFIALFFIMNGAGPISLDRIFCRKCKEETP